MKKNIIRSFLLSIFLSSFVGTVNAASPSIVNVTSDKTTVGKFEKIEWTFDLSNSYPNPYYYYDAADTPASNPSNMSWFGVDGVTVDLHLTSPSGKQITVPAFWMEDYLRIRNSGFQVLGKKDNGKWHVRFAPSEVGAYQYYITAQDKSGSGRFPGSGTQSFTVTNTSKKGFIRVSPIDPRFMSYDDGSSYVPIPAGRQWWHGNEGGLRSYSYDDLFTTYFGPNKVNLVRIWDQSDFALAVEDAQPVWIREGYATIPGGALGTEINSANVRSGLRAARPTSGQGWYQRLAISEPTKQHKLTVWVKVSSASDIAQINFRNGAFYNAGTLLGQVTSDAQAATDWKQYSVTFTPNTSMLSINLLRSSGSGFVYIDDIEFGPIDGSGNISYNIVSDPGMERHFAKDISGNDPNTDANLPRPIGNFMNPWSSYELDKIVESAETNGVAIQLCSCSGPWFTWPVKQDQINYADTWVLKSWQRNFRYRVARWGYSQSILAWEKHNEHGHINQNDTPGLWNFYQSYGAYQKAIDPYGHLRTTSQGSQAFSPGLWSSAAMDLANYHDYMMQFRSANITNDEPHFVAYARAWCLRYQGGYCTGLGLGDGTSWTGSQKPWVWGEIDVGTAAWDQANPATANGEGRLRFLRNSLWSGLFSPLGTAGLDWYWDNEDSATKTAKYAQRKVAANFFSTVDYHGANFTYFMTQYDAPPSYNGEIIAVTNDPNTKARVLAMRRADKKAAYAWVHHRDSVWYTSPTVPSAISPTITIANLLSSDTYKIEVWNTKTGTIISTTNQTPTNGSLSFTVSNLTDDVAVKIESTAGVPTNTPTQSPTVATKPGDANGDNKVDGIDYITWLNNYNTTTSSGASKGDFNKDGKVDGIDYITWLTNYGL